MIHSNKFDDNVRIPIIPLPAEMKHLRTKGEIMIDDKEKKILFVDRNDRSIIHDLTDWIVSHLDEINGDLIYITIEGIGSILLNKIIKDILNQIKERTIEAEDISDFTYFYPKGDIDMISISPYANKLEITGFLKAEDNNIPIKSDNKLIWTNIYDLIGGGNSGGNNSGSTNDGESSIDLAYGNVYDIIPQNQVLYLIISKRQQSRYLSGNHLLVLPKSIYSYISIEWNIFTNDEYLTLTYQDNIFFSKDEFNKFKPNTRYHLSFISHDKGKTWICDIKEYNYKYMGGE